MAMRSQIYEWTNLAPNGTGSTLFRRSTDTTVALTSGTAVSVFIGGTGYNITKPAETTATQFVVIEDVACTPDGGANQTGGLVVGTNTLLSSLSVPTPTAATPGTYSGTIGVTANFTTSGSGTDGQITVGIAAGGTVDVGTVTVSGTGYAVGDTITVASAVIGGAVNAVFTLTADDIALCQNGGYTQIRINTTNYFQNPDVTQQDGIPGLASPYPRGVCNILKTFDLYPDIYVLPGQVYDVIYTQGTQNLNQNEAQDVVGVFLKYTLYDGPDALIANKLLELGITVNPNNVDWYKRTLIEQQSVASV
jgi:hypothetical protein